MKNGAAFALLAAFILYPAIASHADESDPKVITMDVADEPGRVSDEDVHIEDGPYKRQVVFYRTNAAPGTLVVSTPDRFLYLVLGDNRALRYGMESAAKAFNGLVWSRSRVRRLGLTGRRLRK